MTQWKPVTPTEPPNDLVALFYQSDGLMCIGSLYRNSAGTISFDPSGIFGWEYDCDMRSPTHWMPLPESPK